MRTSNISPLTSKELSPSTWKDFEALFVKHNGVWGGCWCMFYHQQGTFQLGGQERANRNRDRKLALVKQGRTHGIIVYSNKTPVGWCQCGVKDELPRMDASRSYLEKGLYKGKKKLWRITCFFIDRDHRGKGIARFALSRALGPIRKRGGGVVEAYPLKSAIDLARKTSKGRASLLWS